MTTSISAAALAWLLTYAVHSTVLLGSALLLVRVRRWTPAAAEILWKTAMVGSILTATLQLQLDVRPAGTVSLVKSPAATASAKTPSSDEHVSAAQADEEPVGLPELAKRSDPSVSFHAANNPPTTASATGASASFVVVAVWATIALLLAVAFGARRLVLVGRLGDRRAVHDGRIIEILSELSRDTGLSGTPRLTTTVSISSPVALGIREICIPESALTELDVEQQRSMLAHELAHLARRDPLWLVLASIIERVFWIQPLNRVARRQIATAAEYLCDDWAVHRTGSGLALARCLAQVAEWIQASPLGVPVSGMAEERSLLVSRVSRLLEDRMPSTASRRALVLGAIAMLLGTVVLVPSVSGKTAPDRTLDDQRPSASEAVITRGPTGSDAPDDVTPMLAVMEHKRSGVLTAADSAVVVALIARLKDEDAEVRQAAAEALGKLEDARAVPGLIEALKDRDKRVRASAAQSLGQFKDGRSMNALVALLSDSSTEVKRQALEALSEFEEGVPSAGIVRLLDDRDSEIRHKAAHLVGQLHDRSASGALAKLIRDSNADVRSAAIEALSELHDVSAGSAILPALGDVDADVRQQALSALSDLKTPIPEATLIALLRDTSPDVRSHAADLAGERSVVAAIPALRRMLEDANGDVRQNAVSALSNIADAAAHDALRAALNSKDPKVRRAAVEALGERRQ
ncbi:MAG: M56 family metallopeptidase [Gemmatimonadota bacterium]